jgi:pyridoxamine 5'-phosphate oxidase
MASPFDALRVEYSSTPLERADLDPDPVVQLGNWLEQAAAAGVVEPNAFVLATSGPDRQPAARAVLLKDLSAEGLVFFTNYRSRKGQELDTNPLAAAAFVWTPVRRQVRVEGRVEKVSPEISDAYFASRPPEARLASAASPQSQPVESREALEAALAELRARYPEGDLPRPAHWGGYRLLPESFEFWQGREARFHDRFEYRRRGRDWQIERLAP